MSGLNGIEQIRHLEYLNCSWNDIVDLEPISLLKNLTYLDLSSNGRMQSLLFDAEMDLQPLKYLNKLEYLNLTSNRNLINFDALHYLKSLRTLDLSETNASEEEIEKIKLYLPDCEILINSVGHDDTDLDFDEENIEDSTLIDYEDNDLPF